MNIEVDTSRGQLIMSNPNRSRKSSIDSNTLSVVYADRI